MDSPTDRMVLDSEDPIDELADALHELQLDRSATESPNRIMSLAQTVVTSDTIEFFTMHYEAALIDWMNLLEKTTLPSDISTSDERVTTIFQTLDALISGTEGKHLSRLAHVQLLRVFDSLEDLVAADRSSGSVRARRGLTNLSIAIDLYQDAQTTRASRCRLHEKRRSIKRYAVLAGPSPIILFLYTDIADKIVYVLSIRSPAPLMRRKERTLPLLTRALCGCLLSTFTKICRQSFFALAYSSPKRQNGRHD